ncbi:MAG: isocitrate lyase/PEP mutase family protein [Hyphomicrobiaceae bacterium]|nr:isocitrate lyase/PEP mutase family protein [Hyphomicrobiaceae bacterium]
MAGLGSASRRLRELMAGKDILVAPGCFNAMGGRIIEQIGFKLAYVSGYGISVNHIGRPDVGLTTLSEVTDVAGKIASAVDIPIICDADTGYGNAINVMRTVEQFIRSGAAGIHLEDQVAPKRCGHVAGKQVISIEEAAGKIRAAAKVRDDLDKNFVLIARCDARGVAGGTLEEAIKRLKAYREAGADVAFPEGLVSEDEIAAVCKEVPGPVLYNRTGVSPNLHYERLQQIGVKIVINPGGAMRAATKAMYDYYAEFKKKDSEVPVDPGLKGHPTENFHNFVGFPEIRQYEEQFLPAEETEKYKGAIGFQP